MGYKKGADGITKTGKTEGKNLGDSGPTVGIENGPKKSTSAMNKNMKLMGKNLARIMNQKKSGRGR
jgi:hypothetical protein